MATQMITIEGLDETLINLAAQVKKIQGRSLKGFIKAGVIIMNASMKNAPRLTGNLAASHTIILQLGAMKPQPTFKGENASEITDSYSIMVTDSTADIQLDKLRGQDSVIVGVGAYYAVFVHEKHAERAKFLQKAISENFSIILTKIKNEASFR